MMEHAYIHIPFCIRKCKYCSFVSGENIKKKDDYLNALIKEINGRYKNDKLKTIYIGGGTPSLLSANDLNDILSLFNTDKNTEITLEVNPETVEINKFTDFKNLGINRISLGVQTFNDKILNYIGRIHTCEVIYSAVNILKKCGFSNISIDLIYGLPYQDSDTLKRDAETAVKLDITHVSTYGLKIEENSYFGKNPPLMTCDDDTQAKMFLFLCDYLYSCGFDHYEISNFSKAGYISLHNCAYWKNKNYYGFGLNAGGYEGSLRYKNISDFNKYIENPFLREEEIILSSKEILEEEIFLSLRLKEGINIEYINKKFGIDFCKKYKTVIEKYLKSGLLEFKNNNLKLTRSGVLLSNEVMCEFI